MSVISMNELLKSRPKKLAGENVVVFGKEKAGKYYYLVFKVGKNVLANAGWAINDFVNFVYDTGEKKGYLESATATTGRPLARAHKLSENAIVRFPFVEGVGLPEPENPYETMNLRVAKGKARFQLQ